MNVSSTAKRQIIDITDQVNAAVSTDKGAALVFVQHTTAAVTTADLDPGTDQDLLEFLQKITPQAKWRHPHDPSHAPDHLLASLIGPSVVVPVQHGQVRLGTWQRVILLELDGPRERTVTIQELKEV